MKEISCTNGYTTNASTGTSAINAQTITVSNNNKTDGSTCTVTFEKSEYDVEIKSNNISYGTVDPTSLKISYGDSKTFTATPKTGYYLSDVSCTNDYTVTGTTGTDAISAQTITVSNNNMTDGSACTVTFVARTFSVDFDANGGNAVSTVLTVTYNQNYADSLPTPTRTGYTFDGWYTQASGGSKVTSTTTVTITSNQTLYAHWTANSYTVNYSSSVSSCSVSGSTNATYDTPFNKANPSCTGYTFNGWKASSGLDTSTAYTGTSSTSVSTSWTSTTTYKKDTYFKNLTAASNGTVSLQAQWTANTYSISYTLNSGSHGTNHPTSGTYDSVLTISNPTRTGYTFDGWTVSAGLNTSTAKYGTSSTSVTTAISSSTTKIKAQYFKNLTASSGGSVTLTANWTANKYKVTLDNQNATTAGTTAYWYKYNTTTTVNGKVIYYYTDEAMSSSPMSNNTITIPTKTGYTFGGYYTGTNGSGTQYVDAKGLTINNIYKTLAGNTTLYAQWTVNTVTLQSNNTSYGTLSVSSIEVPYGESKTFTVTPSNDYEFSYIDCSTGYNAYDVDENKIIIENEDYNGNGSCTVYFVRKPLAVTIDNPYPSWGTVSIPSVSIAYGGTKTFTVTPNTGYYLDSVSCTNNYKANYTSNSSSTQTVTILNNNQTNDSVCKVWFNPIEYNIKVSLSGIDSLPATAYFPTWAEYDEVFTVPYVTRSGVGLLTNYTISGDLDTTTALACQEDEVTCIRITSSTQKINSIYWHFKNLSTTHNGTVTFHPEKA